MQLCHNYQKVACKGSSADPCSRIEKLLMLLHDDENKNTTTASAHNLLITLEENFRTLIEAKMNNVLTTLGEWFTKVKLTIFHSKTTHVLMKTNLQRGPPVRLGKLAIIKSNSTTGYLGCIRNSAWKSHKHDAAETVDDTSVLRQAVLFI